MKIKIENKEYILPDSMGDITIEQFLDVEKLKVLLDGGELTEVEYICEVACTLAGISPDLALQLEVKSFNDLFNEIVRLSNESIEDFKLCETEFELDGVKYKFDTKLDIMPTGVWIDLNDVLKVQDFWDNAPKLFAMLIRPVDKDGNVIKYDIQEINSRIDLFRRKLKLKYFFPIKTFFLTFWSVLQK